MNGTTAKYLNALAEQKDRLADELRAKRVECSKNEVFNTLIDKIGTIYDTGGLAYGEWMPTENTDKFTVSGLNALPTAFGLSCEGIITDYISEEGSIFIALFNYEPGKDAVTFYKYLDDNTFIYDTVVKDLIYSTEQAEDGTYSVTISFEALNEMTVKPYMFKGGYEYNWVASSEGWFL